MSDQDSNAKDPNTDETSTKGRKKRRRRKRRDRSSDSSAKASSTPSQSESSANEKVEEPKAEEPKAEEPKVETSDSETTPKDDAEASSKGSSVNLKALFSGDSFEVDDNNAMSGLDALGLPEPKSIFDEGDDEDKEDHAEDTDAPTAESNDVKDDVSKADEDAQDNAEENDDAPSAATKEKAPAKKSKKARAAAKAAKTSKKDEDTKEDVKDTSLDDSSGNGGDGNGGDDDGGDDDGAGDGHEDHTPSGVETVYIEKEQNASGVLAVFEHPDDILHAAEKARDEGFQVWDVYTPFPVHGMDDAMGIGRSWMPWVTFCLALTGMTTALTIQFGTMYFDWPIIIGGKPFFSWPSFMPITFELSVLFAGIGSVLVMFAANGLPNFRSRQVHPRITRDRFVLWISSDDSKYNRDRTISFLQSLHPMEIQEVKDK